MSIIEKNTEKIVVRGIVRHYHTPTRLTGSLPYRGILKTEKDKDRSWYSIGSLLSQFPDGESVEIIVTAKGEHPKAKGYWWMLTTPNTYERVKKEK